MLLVKFKDNLYLEAMKEMLRNKLGPPKMVFTQLNLGMYDYKRFNSVVYVLLMVVPQ